MEMTRMRRFRLWIMSAVLFLGSSSAVFAVPTIHDTWQGDWDRIDRTDAVSESQLVGDIVNVLQNMCPSDFIMGAASAEYQILGQASLGHSHMAHGESVMPATDFSGDACGGWDQHFKDIYLLEKCSLNGYRFSIDWSALQPKQGEWDSERLQHYVDFCKELRRRNIKVMATMHHFVHPQWFEELGAFERSENSVYFVSFCQKIFNELAPYVDQWCTINEPGIYVFQSYMRGVFPPFKSVTFPGLPWVGLREHWAPCKQAGYCNIALAGTVLRNLLTAHVMVYQACHEIWGKKIAALSMKETELTQHELDWLTLAEKPSIGFVHQYLTFRNFHSKNNMLGRFEWSIARVLNNWISDAVIGFFDRGEFSFTGAKKLNITVPEAKKSFDFVGLNYYSVVSFNLFAGGPDYYDKDIRTDMPYGIYAEGLFHAIKDLARLHKPIYITENGVADASDTVRNTWIKRHFWAIAKALESGCDVRGFFYWSLMDNWEWDMGYGKKFGLYHVDFQSAELTRTLRPGSFIYKAIAEQLQK